MTPREFLEAIVHPNLAEWRAEYADLRRAFNAVAAVDALAAHLYVAASSQRLISVAGINDDSHWRNELASRNPDFALLRDTAKAQKHVHLTRHAPQVTSANQIVSRATGWGEGRFGEGRIGGVQQVVVDLGPGRTEFLESIVDRALAFLEAEMTTLGL